MRQNVSKYMLKAIRLAEKSVIKGGGPFGALIVNDGKIVAQAHNSVTLLNDPTAHAEVIAIRKACKKLKTFDLSGCVIYTSCEPCPMCLSAIYWAHIDKICYAASNLDASAIGFDDSFIYKEFTMEPQYRKIKSEQILRELSLDAFRMWRDKTDKTLY